MKYVSLPPLPISSDQKMELCYFARLADAEARSDLSGGYIRDEDDYTSNFTGALRRIINANSVHGLTASSLMLPTPAERTLGCDACIIVSAGGVTKIVAFEAKWPRFSEGYYRWDYSQTASGLSHFSDQLERQSRYAGSIAIFEMFYCEYPSKTQPSFLFDTYSSCVWHADAIGYDQKRSPSRAPWTQSDLQTLLSSGSLDVGEILNAVCDCRAGKPIRMPGDPAMIAREFGIGGHVLFVEAREPEDESDDRHAPD